MADRRLGVSRRPPPHVDKLIPDYIDALYSDGLLIIGGKTMGGRVVSKIADEVFGEDRIVGLVCRGYPLHPVNKSDQLRTSTLICQGTRD